jgi:hypothetical protein
MTAFITDARLTRTTKQLILTYPRYNCSDVSCNKEHLSDNALHQECSELDRYLSKRKIVTPQAECTDIYEYTVNKGQYTVAHSKQNRCYGFSPYLSAVMKQEDGLLLQFQTETALFQGEFSEAKP